MYDSSTFSQPKTDLGKVQNSAQTQIQDDCTFVHHSRAVSGHWLTSPCCLGMTKQSLGGNMSYLTDSFEHYMSVVDQHLFIHLLRYIWTGTLEETQYAWESDSKTCALTEAKHKTSSRTKYVHTISQETSEQRETLTDALVDSNWNK